MSISSESTISSSSPLSPSMDGPPSISRLNYVPSCEAHTNGNVAGIKTMKVEWTKDETGRWNMRDVPDSETLLKCDMVMLAMGFLGPEKKIVEELETKLDPRGNFQTPKSKYSTSVTNVYAAGDCRRGQSLVVWAISEGRQAARQIDNDLKGHTMLAGPGGLVYQPET